MNADVLLSGQPVREADVAKLLRCQADNRKAVLAVDADTWHITDEACREDYAETGYATKGLIMSDIPETGIAKWIIMQICDCIREAEAED